MRSAVVETNDQIISLTSIEAQIPQLSSSERARIIDVLWDSLDGEHIREVEAKLAAESEARIDAVENGELETVGGPEALRSRRNPDKWKDLI